jgi:Glycoside hydrolase family 5 C-terminal domain
MRGRGSSPASSSQTLASRSRTETSAASQGSSRSPTLPRNAVWTWSARSPTRSRLSHPALRLHGARGSRSATAAPSCSRPSARPRVTARTRAARPRIATAERTPVTVSCPLRAVYRIAMRVAVVLALLRLRRPDHVGAGRSGGRRRPLRAAERRQRQAREAAGPRAPVSARGRRPPRSFGFDPDSGRFELEYSARAPKGDALGRRLDARVDTEVFLPRIQYPEGYSVQVRGPTSFPSPAPGC